MELKGDKAKSTACASKKNKTLHCKAFSATLYAYIPIMPGSKHLLIEFGIHHTLESCNLLENFLNMVRV